MLHQQIIWAARRGMLELDLILEPYARTTYLTADPTMQQLFIALLEEQDPDLYRWLIGSVQAPPHLKPIVLELIRNTSERV